MRHYRNRLAARATGASPRVTRRRRLDTMRGGRCQSWFVWGLVLACAPAVPGCSEGPFASPRPAAGQAFAPAPPVVTGVPGVVPGPIDTPLPGAAAVPAPNLSGPSATAMWQAPPLARAPAGSGLVPGRSIAPVVPIVPTAPGRRRPGLIVTPGRVVAPVGSDVILLAGICGDEGHLLTCERIEWSLDRGGVGQLVAPGTRDWLERLTGFDGPPEKVDNAYAFGITSDRNIILTRGTPTTADDVYVRHGQTWITVSSAVEGTSFVSAYAASVSGWDRRRQTAVIHWVDAQWQFPPPSVNPAGSRHVLTTSITRQSNGAAVTGWIVRYEIISGPPAGLGPQGSQAVEVPTDGLGQASVELVQTVKNAGTNQIAVQVIRPADAAAGLSDRVVLGAGTTTKTWSAPSLTVRCSGPSNAAVGAAVPYSIEVSNPGDLPARGVDVTANVPLGSTFVGSSPQAEQQAATLVWHLGELPAGGTRRIDVNLRPTRPGGTMLCAEVRAEANLAAKDCVTTTVGQDQTLDVVTRLENPNVQTRVGEQVTFSVLVTNRGDTPLAGLVLTDRFEAGLEHPSDKSPIRRTLGALPPGQSQELGVTFRATRAGRLCHTVEVTASGGLSASSRACVDAVDPRAGLGPDASLKITGPDRLRVGQIAKFAVDVTNVGTVPLTELAIKSEYDPPLGDHQASGFQVEGKDLVWRIARLEPGRTARGLVHCECRSAARSACNRVTLTCKEQLARNDQACVEILAADAAEGAAGGAAARERAASLAVSVSDVGDPVRRGEEIVYVVTVQNNGGKDERDVALVVTLPEGTTLKAVQGHSTYEVSGRTVKFAPVLLVRRDEALTFKLRLSADRVGTAQLRASATSQAVRQAVTAQDTTEVTAGP